LSPAFQILVDWTERPHKCTILPLAGHPALEITRLARGQTELPALVGSILLHPDGELLSAAGSREASDRPALSAIDCNWKRLAGILQRIPRPLPRLARIPPGFVTAYPRKNKQDLDPEGGLATIEAIYIAGRFLGIRDDSLLGKYHFASAFLERNVEAFRQYGLE
jgi:pre-rRNA-processing protein TSR3